LTRDSQSILFIIPTYYGEHFSDVLQLVSRASLAGAAPVLVANSQEVMMMARTAGLEVTSTGSNLGYGGAANFAASQRGQFAWLIVCNDDVVLSEISMGELLATVNGLNRWDRWVIGCADIGDPDMGRLPGALRVFTNLSLLDAAVSTLARRFTKLNLSERAGLREVGPYTAVPFVCVAISHAAWTALDGFDEDFQFYYEDSDFLRRANEDASQRFGVLGIQMSHRHSASTKMELMTTLPVLTWSAYLFLNRHTLVKGAAARILITIALLIRMMLVPLASGSTANHWRAVLAALRDLNLGRKVHLPEWKDDGNG
jgi:GT2 family glycosyltransferase